MRSLLRSLTLVALLGASACRDDSTTGDTSAGGDATAGGTLVVSATGDADILVPGLATSITGHQVIDMVFDRLAEIGDELVVAGDSGFQPRLARSWTWAPDSMSIAFALDPRARWHDGRPVRASDVQFSYDIHRNPAVASQVAPEIANIDSVTVRDSLTAVVWFAARGPQQFFEAVRHTPIMPEHVYGAQPLAGLRGSAAARSPVGSGRFRFARWDAGSRLELVADTANYRGRALLDRVIWTFVANPTAALARITAGEADFHENVPPAQAASYDSLPNMRTIPYPVLQYVFMGMNLNARGGSTAPHPVFGDVRVRRALTMAVNRPAMLENVFSGFGQRAYGPFPASLKLSDTTITQLPYDTAAAAALLDSAGWVRGADGIRAKGSQRLAFSLAVPQSSASRMAYGVLLQDQFERIGADVEIETFDFPTFVTRSSGRDYDAALQGWGTDPGPGGFRARWTSAGVGPSGQNVEGYRSPVVDAHADSAVASYDDAKTRADMRAAFQQVVNDAPGIWLYDIVAVAVVHDRIRIPPFRADKWWAHIADWHIPADARIPRDQVGLRPAPTP